jgi:hypothetical protein
VVLIDDLLVTGGTSRPARLLRQVARRAAAACVNSCIPGRPRQIDIPVETLVTYDPNCRRRHLTDRANRPENATPARGRRSPWRP